MIWGSSCRYSYFENVIDFTFHFYVVQLLSHVWLFATPCTAALQASLSFTISQLAQTHVHWVNDAIQPSYPLLPSSPLALNLSQHRGLFQWVGLHIRWPKCWSFSFSISLFNEYSGLISFRIDFGEGSGNPLQFSCLETPMDGGAW